MLQRTLPRIKHFKSIVNTILTIYVNGTIIFVILLNTKRIIKNIIVVVGKYYKTK